MHNFIQVGGIQTILSVLQREIVSESVDQFGDPDTRRGCYSVALDIAKYDSLHLCSINLLQTDKI